MLGLLLAATAAHATLYSLTFCAQYDVTYDDADSGYGDDYVKQDTTYVAQGARLVVTRNRDGLVMRDAYMEWEGASAGCQTSTLTLASSDVEPLGYDVKVHSKASVNGNIVYVHPDDSSLGRYAYGPGAYHPVASGTYTVTTPVADQWRIAEAAGFAMYRRSAGLTGETFNLFNEAYPGTTSNTGYDRDTDRVDVSSTGADNKYMIVHEFGHMLAARANDSGTCATASCAPNKDYTADYNNCYTPSTDLTTHSSNQMEYASAAAWEGIAHYYSVVAFNNTSETDCGWVYYKPTDWNLDGDYTDTEEGDEEGLSRESYPATPQGTGTCDPAGPDYTGRCCWADDVGTDCDAGANGNCDNRSTEYDWLRFFWDLDTDTSLDTTTIFELFDQSDPDTWNADDSGAAGNDPAPRLRNAADGLGYLGAWDRCDDDNGVHR